MYKAFELRAYPNGEQSILFAKTFGCVSKVYNLMLGDKIKRYDQANETLRNIQAAALDSPRG
ncbi:MAG: helix-turn-helix domain-containing protein [Clostridiales bacterium]|nr:helix-turn-helix domain-containing protein [Clostridiales bacterium]